MNTVRIALLLLAAAGLAGCGEKPQVASYEEGRYQGKTDTRPGTPPPSRATSRPGRGLRQRAQKQNEYQRTE